MHPITVILPSGAEVTMRGLGIGVVNILNRYRGQPIQRYLHHAVEHLCEAVHMPAHYKLDRGKIAFGDMLMGDAIVAFLAAYVARWGEGKSFSWKEPCAHCGRENFPAVNVAHMIGPEGTVIDLPESTRDVLAAGRNEFHAEYEGTPFTFRLLSCAEEAKVEEEAAKDPDNVLLHRLAGRIVRWGDTTDRGEILRCLERAPLGALGEIMEEQDGGIDLDIQVTCHACTRAFEATVPFGSRDFLMGEEGEERKSARKRRTRAELKKRQGDSPATSSPVVVVSPSKPTPEVPPK